MVATRSGKTSHKLDTADDAEKPQVKRVKKESSTSVTKKSRKAVNKMASEDTGDGPIYFWRETDGRWGYLSQWYHCPFQDETEPAKTYKTAEHYMMHHKALLFHDESVALQVLKADHPRKCKALGRKVQDFDDATWLAHREAIVRRGNVLKFTRAAVSEEGFPRGGGSLRARLLTTGDRELVEASPFDRIWGIGFTAADAEAAREGGSWGLNLLGKELMEVRRILREEDEKKGEREESGKGMMRIRGTGA